MASVNFNKILSNIRRSYNSAKQAIDQRAERDLARARTRNEKEIVKLRQRKERADLDKQLAEARQATRKAEEAALKAKREAGDVSVLERLSKFSRSLGGKPTRRRKKATTRKKAGTRKRTTASRR